MISPRIVVSVRGQPQHKLGNRHSRHTCCFAYPERAQSRLLFSKRVSSYAASIMNEYFVDHGQVIERGRISPNIVLSFLPLAQKIFFVSISLIGIFNLLDFYLYEYESDLSKRWLEFSEPITIFMSRYVWSIDQIESDLRTIALHSKDTLSWYDRIPISKNVLAFDWIFSIACIAGTVLASLLDFSLRGKIIRAAIEKHTRGIKLGRNWGDGLDISLKGIVIVYILLTPIFALIILTDLGYCHPISLYRDDISFMASIVYFYFWLPMPAATLVLCLTYLASEKSAESAAG
jgi:hypothetical protein